MKDINTHSLMWNPHSNMVSNASLLEKLIESYELIINNDHDFITCPSNQDIVFIINLALNSAKLGLLYL